jgi:hypothetical protein
MQLGKGQPLAYFTFRQPPSEAPTASSGSSFPSSLNGRLKRVELPRPNQQAKPIVTYALLPPSDQAKSFFVQQNSPTQQLHQYDQSQLEAPSFPDSDNVGHYRQEANTMLYKAPFENQLHLSNQVHLNNSYSPPINYSDGIHFPDSEFPRPCDSITREVNPQVFYQPGNAQQRFGSASINRNIQKLVQPNQQLSTLSLPQNSQQPPAAQDVNIASLLIRESPSDSLGLDLLGQDTLSQMNAFHEDNASEEALLKAMTAIDIMPYNEAEYTSHNPNTSTFPLLDSILSSSEDRAIDPDNLGFIPCQHRTSWKVVGFIKGFTCYSCSICGMNWKSSFDNFQNSEGW